MSLHVNDFVIHIATVNGSGSLSANQILTKTFFRMGIPVGPKNFFPSNIAGLPTWYTIRLNENGFVSHKREFDIVVGMNKASLMQDIASVKPEGIFVYNSDFKLETSLLREDVTNIGIPCRELVKDLSKSMHIKKLLTNMLYVGVLAEALGADTETLEGVVADFFNSKPSVIESNEKAIQAGVQFAKDENLKEKFIYKVQKVSDGNKNKLLIDGNTAGALGLVFGGCQFMSWYPITPSSSVAENFQKYANSYRKNSQGKNQFAVIQAEDELSAISMVIGAGWAGARAVTATSGPGLSLMAEAAGLSYFAEVPAVIWDVQRAGPSTGLPTRTLQGDIMSAAKLSHGDTEHIVLLPASPKECFEFGQVALDLAERLQSLVIVLSDLDLGMNSSITEKFQENTRPLDRGKVLSEKALSKMEQFNRYEDVDGDGIPYRTLPGTESEKAAYFTRGTGHTPQAKYSEDPEVFKSLLDRLKKKMNTAKQYTPKPEVHKNTKAQIGIIAFGSSDSAIHETLHLLKEKNIEASYLRVRSLPLSPEVDEFIATHEKVYVVEQNRDGQMLLLIKEAFPQHCSKYRSITQYDGWPLDARHVSKKVIENE